MNLEKNQGQPSEAENFRFPDENEELEQLTDEEIDENLDAETAIGADEELKEEITEEKDIDPVTFEEASMVEKEMSENNLNIDNVVGDIDDGFAEFSEKFKRSESDPEITDGFAEKAKELIASLYGDYKKILTEIDKLYEENKDLEAIQKAESFTKEAREKAKKYFQDKIDQWFKEHDDISGRAEDETDTTKKEKLLKLALEAVDFVPFVGDLKMITEGAVGRTAQGKKLKGFSRFMHTAEGVGFLIANVATLGKGGTALKGMKSAKIFTRSAAALRKFGFARKIYKPIYKVGKFLGKVPLAGKVVDKAFKYIFKRRKIRQGQVIKDGVDTVMNEEEVENKNMAA